MRIDKNWIQKMWRYHPDGYCNVNVHRNIGEAEQVQLPEPTQEHDMDELEVKLQLFYLHRTQIRQ